MPATDKYWRPMKRMHVVFALTAVILLVVTLLMMGEDHSREWKDHQRTAEKIETLRLQVELNEEGALTPTELSAVAAELTEEQRELLGFDGEYDESEYLARKAAITEQIREAQEKLQERADTIRPIREQVYELESQFDLASRRDREQKAFRDKARADYDLAVRDELPQPVLDRLFAEFEEADELVAKNVVQVEEIGSELEAKRRELEAATAELDELQAELKQFELDEQRLRDAKQRFAPDNWFAAAKREVMEWPIVDGFNSHLKIRQDWLPDLNVTLGMAEVARFDRCRTCHVNADRILAGNLPAYPHGEVESEDWRDWVAENRFPHPFSTHPRPEVYLTATSPHPVTEFGCTICHQGNGSGTSFQNAEHGPNDPHQEHEWTREYGYHPNHFWEYPMYGERFTEAGCIKCHHSVVELGVHPEFGATAPKVYEGFQLISDYGCFGCHQVNGYDGDDRIGPDLRLEPNYAEVAAQVLTDDLVQQADPVALAEAGLTGIQSTATEIVDDPLDSDEARERLRSLLEEDENREAPKLSWKTHALGAGLQDVAHPGQLRKVGPSLRHIREKTFKGWMEFWIEMPSRFRPSTKMPQFWHLANQQDDLAHQLTPVEVSAVAQYLWDESQPIELLEPPQGYEPDAIRGATLFAQKGCLACHSIDAFPEGEADFAPDLSRVWAKIKPPEEGESLVESEGFQWLYTWILDPQRHHPRTKMPVLFVNETATDDENPAADIAAFLLGRRPALVLTDVGEERQDVLEIVGDAVGLDPETQTAEIEEYLTDLPRTIKVFADREQLTELREELGEAGASVEVREDDVDEQYGRDRYLAPDEEALQSLARLYLTKTLTVAQTEKLLETGEYPHPSEDVKGDEMELTGPRVDVDGDEWRNRLERYVGRRTISRYGCYACHDVPGFEMARPIGTALQDWGRKETSKLAPEHIAEYLKHHGERDGGSTVERVERALAMARGGEFKSDEEAAEALGPAYFVEDLLHHGRAGFIWQKLRQPRSYDYAKIETKGFDERLRMPRFPFDEQQIEAISTFVLGLVAEPPAERYVYTPSRPVEDRIEGERLLEKYNCTGCHYVEIPEVRLAIDLSETENNFSHASSLAEFAENSPARPEDVLAMLGVRPFRKAIVGTTEDGKSLVDFHGITKQRVVDPADPDDIFFSFHSFELWENLDLSDEDETRLLSVEGAGIRVLPGDVVSVGPGRGGDFTDLITANGAYVEKLQRAIGPDPHAPTADVASKEMAWQMGPPPLILEGHKVQTPWLFNFLRNPYRLRPMTVLRMPKFNMSEDEARSLANYFAAVDDVPYPYQQIEQTDDDYLVARRHLANAELESRAEETGEPFEPIEDYLNHSWRALGKQAKCIGCHEYGEFEFDQPLVIGETKRGPELDRVSDRLRPDWLRLWLANPKWFLPYTAMPVNFPKPEAADDAPAAAAAADTEGVPNPGDDYFGGHGDLQITGLRDALLNYPRALQLYGKVEPPAPAPVEGNPAPTPETEEQP